MVTAVQTDNAPNQMLLIADQIVIIRDEIDELEARISDLKAQKETQEIKLVEMMVLEEVEKFTRNGKTFYPTVRTYASIRGEYKEEAIQWLKNSPHKDLVKETVNTQTLSSWYKETSEEGGIPEEFADMLTVYDKISIAVRKGK